jgi:hypothetical protein
MPSVVAQKRPHKLDRPSPIQIHERRGSGGLLSRCPVHAGRGNEESVEAAQDSEGRDMDMIRHD